MSRVLKYEALGREIGPGESACVSGDYWKAELSTREDSNWNGCDMVKGGSTCTFSVTSIMG